MNTIIYHIFVIAIFLAIFAVLLIFLLCYGLSKLKKRNQYSEKVSAYEYGFDPYEGFTKLVDVRFFSVSILMMFFFALYLLETDLFSFVTITFQFVWMLLFFELILLLLGSFTFYLMLHFHKENVLLCKLFDPKSIDVNYIINYYIVCRFFMLHKVFVKTTVFFGDNTNFHKVLCFYGLGILIWFYEPNFILEYLLFVVYLLAPVLFFPIFFYTFPSWTSCKVLKDYSDSIAVSNFKKNLDSREIYLLITEFFGNPGWSSWIFNGGSSRTAAFLFFGGMTVHAVHDVASSVVHDYQVRNTQHPRQDKVLKDLLALHEKYVGTPMTPELLKRYSELAHEQARLENKPIALPEGEVTIRSGNKPKVQSPEEFKRNIDAIAKQVLEKSDGESKPK